MKRQNDLEIAQEERDKERKEFMKTPPAKEIKEVINHLKKIRNKMELSLKELKRLEEQEEKWLKDMEKLI